MDKLQRLRWIPMLVKAYSDARVRQELQRMQQSHTALPPANEHAARTVLPAAMRSARNKPKYPKRKATPQDRMHSVLREIRETRRQIGRLESIQAQLTELQSKVDGQMNQLLERLNQSQTQTQIQAPGPGNEPAARNNLFQ